MILIKINHVFKGEKRPVAEFPDYVNIAKRNCVLFQFFPCL